MRIEIRIEFGFDSLPVIRTVWRLVGKCRGISTPFLQAGAKSSQVPDAKARIALTSTLEASGSPHFAIRRQIVRPELRLQTPAGPNQPCMSLP